MKNLCYFLRQNIVQKPSMASIKGEQRGESTHTAQLRASENEAESVMANNKIVHVDRRNAWKGFIVYP